MGGGLKTFEETVRPTKDVLPKKCDWIKAKVVNFDPDNNTVTTSDGQKVCKNQTGLPIKSLLFRSDFILRKLIVTQMLDSDQA